MWFNSKNTALPRLRRRCDSVHPLHFRGCSSSAERSFDMREAKGAAPFVPTIFEGIAQSARADASHASGQRCKSFCPHHFLSLWCSPVNMPASHAGDHRSEAGQGRHFHRRVVHGEKQTHLTQNQAALDVQVVSRRPFPKPPKHFQRCICSVSRPA